MLEKKIISSDYGFDMDEIFQSLLEQIRGLPRPEGRACLVGVSGFGGSGKSTLCRGLAEVLPGVCIVGMDDFWLHSADVRSADWPAFDRDRIEAQVLNPALAGQPVRYQRYDWKQQTLGDWVEVPDSQFLIVEGISALHPNLLPYYDFKIWVDCTLETAKERGLARGYGWGIDETQVWLERWMPNDADYFAKYRPDLQADFIYPTG